MTRFLCDSNVWVALVVDHHDHGRECREWFAGLQAPDRLFFCRSTQQSFLRLMTTAAVFSRYGSPPLENDSAWRTYEAMYEDGRVGYLGQEPDGIDGHWKAFTARPVASPKLWMDAYLAAFALAGGLTLVTTDTAFRQFEGLDHLVLGSAADGVG